MKSRDLSTDKDILSAVYDSISKDDITKLRELLKENPQLIELKEFGATFNKTLLHYAAHKGFMEMCKLLYSIGANVNSSIDGDTPLCEASTEGHIDVVKWLIENGATVDGVFSTVASPLMCAIIFGHNEIAKYLIYKGADINRIHLNLYQTPLDLSIIWGRTEIEKILREKGAKATLQKNDWSKEFGGSIIQYVNDNAGTVLPILLTPIVKADTINVTQRVAIINKGKNKYLFTVGLFAIHKPMLELFITLPESWNMLDNSMGNQFPSALLLALTQQIINGLSVKEGGFISADDDSLSKLVWPKDVLGFWICDYYWTQNVEKKEQNENSVMLLTLIPVLKTKNNKMQIFDTEKNRKASWAKITLNI